MGRKLVASTLVALILLTLAGAAVSAAPLRSPHAEVMVVDCNGAAYEIVVARGNAAHVLGSNQRLIPHHFTWELEIDDEVRLRESEGVGQGQKRGLQNRLVTCTFEFDLSAEDFLPEDIQYLADELGIEYDEALALLEGATTIIGRGLVEAMITSGGPRR